jgi:hypothetical protein
LLPTELAQYLLTLIDACPLDEELDELPDELSPPPPSTGQPDDDEVVLEVEELLVLDDELDEPLVDELVLPTPVQANRQVVTKNNNPKRRNSNIFIIVNLLH